MTNSNWPLPIYHIKIPNHHDTRCTLSILDLYRIIQHLVLDMKNLLLLLFITCTSLANAQDCPVSKSDVVNGKIEFRAEKISENHARYYFTNDEGTSVGPCLDMKDGVLEFFHFDKKGVKNGFYLQLDGEERLYGLYEDGVPKGNHFVVNNSLDPIDAYNMKKFSESPLITPHKKGDAFLPYRENKSVKESGGRGNTSNGFGGGMYYDDYYLGYWKKGYPESPFLVTFLENKSIHSTCSGNYTGYARNGLCIYKWYTKSQNQYFGYYKKDNSKGLGITMSDDYRVISAGWFEAGYKCTIDLNNSNTQDLLEIVKKS